MNQVLKFYLFYAQLLKHLEKTNDWQVKKQSMFSLLPAQLINENTHKLADRIYNLLKHLPLVKVSSVKLKATCVLIRCSEDLYELDESYGLTEVYNINVTFVRLISAKVSRRYSIPNYMRICVTVF